MKNILYGVDLEKCVVCGWNTIARIDRFAVCKDRTCHEGFKALDSIALMALTNVIVDLVSLKERGE
tara:strand:- start:1247 stop:1444 length:198 start_codon:yes stop_codon:yes gene_type:complete